jgi:hypothetical protein
MMVMMTKGARNIFFLTLLLALIAGGTLFGQQKDFQTWFEAEVKQGLKNGIELSGEFEQRFYNNSTRYDRTQLTVAASYDPLDYLSTSGGIRFLSAADKDGDLHPAFRIHGDAKGKYARWDVDFSLRVRFQYGFEEFFYFTSFSENAFVNRYRFKAAYHIFGSRFDVFASLEPWGLINNYNGHFFKKMRYAAGGSYRLNMQSEIGLRYILEDEFNRLNPLQSHILVFSYTYNL